MTDRIELRGLQIRGYHGVFDYEREAGQEFFVDVALDVDMAAAVRSDDIADTVDYGSLATAIAEIVGGDPVNLIETLAERIANACLDDERVQAVTVSVHKPNAPIPLTFSDVVVTVRRSRGNQ